MKCYYKYIYTFTLLLNYNRAYIVRICTKAKIKLMPEKRIIKGSNKNTYLFPFILITSLFFLWGFAHSLLDVLNKHFQDSLDLTKAESAAVQASAYGAYFIMAIPAGIIAKRFGYKMGIVVGLLLFAIGSFWFIPAVEINAFGAFLIGLLILFCGLTCLETVANPYVIRLGSPERAASRINLSQTFNALGWIVGPLVGSILVFPNEAERSIIELFTEAVHKIFGGSVSSIEVIESNINNSPIDNSALILPYVGLGTIVLLVLVLFVFIKLPEISEEQTVSNAPEDNTLSPYKFLFKQKHFVFAIIAQFLYVAAQTGIGSFFINYTIEIKELGLTEIQAGLLLGMGGMTLFAIGRLSGSVLMRKINPGILLGFCGAMNTLLMICVMFSHDRFGVIALIGCYLFMSIMFPSIFALGIKGLGEKTKTASSVMILTIVGGAIAPFLMGIIGANNMSIGFSIPLICFLYISFFGFVGSKMR